LGVCGAGNISKDVYYPLLARYFISILYNFVRGFRGLMGEGKEVDIRVEYLFSHYVRYAVRNN
jgi:hypothetical protein